MPNTRDIRKRIRSVKNTGKITRAMQLVAASKMKRAQDLALEGRPYAELLARMLATLSTHLPEDYSHPFFTEREVKTRGVLMISTDRGLCGALNANLYREAIKLDSASTHFYTIGRKGRQFIARTNRKLIADFELDEKPRFHQVRAAVEMMIDHFREGEIDSLEVLYPRFKNTLVQISTLSTFLPLDNFHDQMAEKLRDSETPLLEEEREFKFEPNPAAILDELLDRFIKREIYQLVVEARASEHSARMVAMKSATDNAKKLADQLTLQYNKVRQASITQEILEITAATQFSGQSS